MDDSRILEFPSSVFASTPLKTSADAMDPIKTNEHAKYFILFSISFSFCLIDLSESTNYD